MDVVEYFRPLFETKGSSAYTILLCVSCLVLYYLNSLFALRNTNTVPSGKHFLLIIAHPDDECMFFSPTVLGLTNNNNKVSVLCLSSGNADGIGKIREKELTKSCQMLGCQAQDVHLIDHIGLQDSIETTWESKVIVKELSTFIRQKKQVFDAFITFDDFGVSSHPNHTSILPAIKAYNAALPKNQAKIPVWKLLTTSLVRKYSGLLDAMPSLILITFRVARAPGKGAKKKENFMCFMSDPAQVVAGQRAMVSGHRSQMRWFRWFWVIIGRYMYINELKKQP